MTADVAWFADEELWTELGPAVFDAQRWGSARSECAELRHLLDLRRPSRVLDVPCGPGRHLFELAGLGHRVTGVDLCASYLDAARRRLCEAGLQAELVRCDMRAFARPGHYDLALHLYTSFGYFADPRDDGRLLDRFRGNLRPSGSFVLETLTRETVSVASGRERVVELEDGGRIQSTFRLARGGRVLERCFVVERRGRKRHFWARHRLYSVPELLGMVARAGLVEGAAYADFGGTPFGSGAGYAVIVARRPAARSAHRPGR